MSNSAAAAAAASEDQGSCDDSHFANGWTEARSYNMQSFELGMHAAGAQTLMSPMVVFYPAFFAHPWELRNTQGQEVWPHRQSQEATHKAYAEQIKTKKDMPHQQSQEAIHKAYAEHSKTEKEAAKPTTIMMRNIANNCTRAQLLEILRCCNFDFVYLPMDFETRANAGYAFVNMISSSDADRAMQQLDGFRREFCRRFASKKVVEMEWASTQGLFANVEGLRNNPVMHSSVPDDFKPLLFRQGVLMDFPPPTKQVRAPRTKKK